MNYIPGSAEIILEEFEENKPSDVYEIYVECDANDGDYMKDTSYIKNLSELDILMIAYLRLSRYDVEWPDAREAISKNCNYPFGGSLIIENYRFNRDGDDKRFSWLDGYSSEKGFLLYAGMCDQSCHSIDDLCVMYYDKEGKLFGCGFPDLYKLFDTEKEFIDYIKSIE